MYTKHTIDDNSLNDLAMDGWVLEILPEHDKFDENNINDTSSCLSSQEKTDKVSEESKINWGPKQGDTTGSNYLIEANV